MYDIPSSVGLWRDRLNSKGIEMKVYEGFELEEGVLSGAKGGCSRALVEELTENN